jgi:hypothetical protein
MIKDIRKNRKVEYRQEIEYIGRYRVIHNIPILTDEEKEKIDKEILIKLINCLSND